jgi:hypothetical protein
VSVFFFQAETIARHVQELLAFSKFNFLLLKRIAMKGGSCLVEEFGQAFQDKTQFVPPGQSTSYKELKNIYLLKSFLIFVLKAFIFCISFNSYNYQESFNL